MNDVEKLKEKLKAISGRERVDALINLAFAIHGSTPEETQQYGQEALALAQKLNYKKGIASGYKTIGISFHVRGNYDQAIEYYLKDVKIMEEIGDKANIASSYNNIGIIYRNQGNFELALGYYHKSLKIFKEIPNKKGIATAYSNIGLTYSDRENADGALEYNLKSLNIREEINDKKGMASCYNNIGIIYENLEKFDLALEYHLKSLKIEEELGNAIGIATSYNNIGIIQIRLRKYDPATDYLHKGLQIALEIGAKDKEIESYGALSDVYEEKEDYKQSLYYYKRYNAVKDMVFNEKKSEQIAEMQTKYETEKKEKEKEIYRLKNVELKREISERKQAQEHLMESKQFIERIAQTSPNIISLFNLPTEEHIYKSRSILELFGYTGDEDQILSPEPEQDLNHPDDFENIREFADDLIHLEDNQRRKLEYRVKDARHEWHWLCRTATVFARNDKGVPCQIVSVYENITERKQMEEMNRLKNIELRQEINKRKEKEEALRLFKMVIENINLGVTIIDPEGKIIYTNPAEARQHGYTVDELLGQPGQIFSPSGKNKKMIQEEFISSHKWRRERLNIRKNGITFPVQLSSAVINNDDSQPIGRVTICEDITERKQMEKLQRLKNLELAEANRKLIETQKQLVESEKMASLGNLVAGVAHEISTPVGIGVTASSDLIGKTEKLVELYNQDRFDSEDLENYLQETYQIGKLIFNNMQRTGELVQSFKQVSVDKSTDQYRQFNLKSYLENVIISLKPKLKEKPIRIDIDCPQDLMLTNYPGTFAQIITNFVMNSMIHGFRNRNSGEIKITIIPDDQRLKLRYHDNGKGIPKDVLPQIFEPFFTMDKQIGTGLGLHIVYNLVTQKLKGSIHCNSNIDDGVSFEINAPMNIGDNYEKV